MQLYMKIEVMSDICIVEVMISVLFSIYFFSSLFKIWL